MLGLWRPRASRRIAETMAQTLVADRASLEEDLPPDAPVAPQHEAVLISDFLSPVRDITAMVEGISSRGARGHLVMIVDPVEETFPFQGQAVLHDLEDGLSLRIGDADRPGAMPTADGSSSTGPSCRNWPAAAAGRSPSTGPTARRAKSRFAS